MSIDAVPMVRSVSLSDEAFRVLRMERRSHESDSDVVIRLQREARRRERDPSRFFHHPPAPELTPDESQEHAERMRAADRDRRGAS